MLNKLANFAAFQLGWFACIVGAGTGHPWIGVVVVLISVAIHSTLLPRRNELVALVIFAMLLGLLSDGLLLILGVVQFPDRARLITPVPLWMIFMWANFALTIPISLQWMTKRYSLAALLGFVGGPVAYYTGMKLDAVLISGTTQVSLFLIGLEWGIAMPVLMYVHNQISFNADQERAAQTATEGMAP